MQTPLSRPATEQRICELIERGWTLKALQGQPGFPSRQTMWRWRRESPVFALALRQARDARRGVALERWQRPFDAARAEALLERVRQGEALKDLLRGPPFPRRRTLDHWKKLRPDFAQALAAAVGDPARPRKAWTRPYDEAVADRIICRLSAGGRLSEVLREPGMPGVHVLARWRQARPDSDHAVRMGFLAGRRRRRRALPPELAAKICRRLEKGATLDSLGKDMPHRVTLQRWMRQDAALAQQVRTAGWLRDQPLADEALTLAEQATPETLDAARGRIAEIRRMLGQRGLKRRRPTPVTKAAP